MKLSGMKTSSSPCAPFTVCPSRRMPRMQSRRLVVNSQARNNEADDALFVRQMGKICAPFAAAVLLFVSFRPTVLCSAYPWFVATVFSAQSFSIEHRRISIFTARVGTRATGKTSRGIDLIWFPDTVVPTSIWTFKPISVHSPFVYSWCNIEGLKTCSLSVSLKPKHWLSHMGAWRWACPCNFMKHEHVPILGQ